MKTDIKFCITRVRLFFDDQLEFAVRIRPVAYILSKQVFIKSQVVFEKFTSFLNYVISARY